MGQLRVALLCEDEEHLSPHAALSVLEALSFMELAHRAFQRAEYHQAHALMRLHNPEAPG